MVHMSLPSGVAATSPTGRAYWRQVAAGLPGSPMVMPLADTNATCPSGIGAGLPQ